MLYLLFNYSMKVNSNYYTHTYREKLTPYTPLRGRHGSIARNEPSRVTHHLPEARFSCHEHSCATIMWNRTSVRRTSQYLPITTNHIVQYCIRYNQISIHCYAFYSGSDDILSDIWVSIQLRLRSILLYL